MYFVWDRHPECVSRNFIRRVVSRIKNDDRLKGPDKDSERDAICCNCAKNGVTIFKGFDWSRDECWRCKDRRSQEHYRCRAHQAKGMMNWSCNFCHQGKGAHFKGVY